MLSAGTTRIRKRVARRVDDLARIVMADGAGRVLGAQRCGVRGIVDCGVVRTDIATLAFAQPRIALTASVTTNATSDALGETVARFHRPLGISFSFRLPQ